MSEIHFKHYGKPLASCGANPPGSKRPELTDDPDKVTCKTCLKSWSLRDAKAVGSYYKNSEKK